jgi:hypothetical protein
MTQGNEAPGANIASSSQATRYEICYRPLSEGGRPLSFPCDEHGHVHMDALTERALNSYLYARAVVGREFARPAVLPCELPH